jgi:hypothetical protein
VTSLHAPDRCKISAPTYYRIDFALCFALAIHALPLLSKGVLHMPVVGLCIWKEEKKDNCFLTA